MGTALRQRARRGCLVAAASCMGLAIGLPSSGAQEEDTIPRPEVFRSTADSLVASVQIDRDALLPVPDTFRFIALDGHGMYETSSWQARSSVVFPGNGLILGPDLACGTFGGQFPPEFKPILDACLAYRYPLTVFADDFDPDGSTQGAVAVGSPGDPVSGNAARAAAHAGADAVTTNAAIQDLRVLGLPDVSQLTDPMGFKPDVSVFSVDNATSRTKERILQGDLAVDAESTLSGVRMLGGILEIGSLRSVSQVTDDADGKRTSVAELEIGGVTVAGVPAQITHNGLVVGSPAGPSGPLAQAEQARANELLRELGVKVTTLPSEEKTQGAGPAVASVGGLLIEFALDVTQLPSGEVDPNGTYTGSIQLGTTGVLGAAYTFGTEPPTEPIIDPPVFDGGDGFDGGFSGGDEGSVGGDVAFPPSVEEPTAPEVPERSDTPLPRETVVRSLDDLFGGRVGLVYLSLMFAVIGLAVVPLTIPARFGG